MPYTTSDHYETIFGCAMCEAHSENERRLTLMIDEARGRAEKSEAEVERLKAINVRDAAAYDKCSDERLDLRIEVEKLRALKATSPEREVVGWKVAIVFPGESTTLYSRGKDSTSTSIAANAKEYERKDDAIEDRDHWRSNTCYPPKWVRLIRITRPRRKAEVGR
jgi:hypothetical protein